MAKRLYEVGDRVELESMDDPTGVVGGTVYKTGIGEDGLFVTKIAMDNGQKLVVAWDEPKDEDTEETK